MSLPIRTLRDGLTVVATAGTRVQLRETGNPTTGPVTAVIQALGTNTGTVVIGGPTCVAAAGTQGTPTRRGIALAAGASISLDLMDITGVYIDAATNGDGVSWVIGAS